MKRRYFLAGSVATLATPALARITESDIRLCKLAPKGLDISSIHSEYQSASSLKLTRRHCSVVVPEYGLKAQHVYKPDHPKCQTDGTHLPSPNWSAADDAKEFSDTSRMGFHAHTLYWPKHGWPNCFSATPDAQRTFIRTFAEKIAGAETCDVLNEVLWKDKGKDGDGSLFALLDRGEDFSEFDVWSRVLNPNMRLDTRKQRADLLVFIVQTLREELADLNSSATRLLINEDQLTWPDKGPMIKRGAMLGLLDYLESQGARLDGVGLQGHILANIGIDAAGTQKFIQDLGCKNYDVHFSELDYDDTMVCRTIEESDNAHKEALCKLLSACLPEENVKRVGFWGLLDREHHLHKGTPTARPALFDTKYQAKPIFSAMADILSAQKAR